MHTHDRTLIQSLQLDDDRKRPGHDEVVRYLSRPDVAVRLLTAVYQRVLDTPSEEAWLSGEEWVLEVMNEVLPAKVEVLSVESESLITKGSGTYRTHIGFADLVIKANVWRYGQHYVWSSRRETDRHYTEAMWKIRHGEIGALVEVKAGPWRVPDVVRQLKLYAEYVTGAPRLVVASPSVITAGDADTLKREHITYIHVSDAYKAVPLNEANVAAAVSV